MNSVMRFVFDSEEVVRVVEVDDVPFFCVKDICRCLDIVDHIDALGRVFEEDARKIEIINTSNSLKETWFVNESGFYQLVFSSRKDSARIFGRWVCMEVLPSIRKTGKYEVLDPENPISHFISTSCEFHRDHFESLIDLYQEYCLRRSSFNYQKSSCKRLSLNQFDKYLRLLGYSKKNSWHHEPGYRTGLRLKNT